MSRITISIEPPVSRVSSYDVKNALDQYISAVIFNHDKMVFTCNLFCVSDVIIKAQCRIDNGMSVQEAMEKTEAVARKTLANCLAFLINHNRSSVDNALINRRY